MEITSKNMHFLLAYLQIFRIIKYEKVMYINIHMLAQLNFKFDIQVTI